MGGWKLEATIYLQLCFRENKEDHFFLLLLFFLYDSLVGTRYQESFRQRAEQQISPTLSAEPTRPPLNISTCYIISRMSTNFEIVQLKNGK